MADHDNRWRDDRNYRRPGGERDFYGRDERGEDDYGQGYGEEGMTNFRLRDPSRTRDDHRDRPSGGSGRQGYGTGGSRDEFRGYRPEGYGAQFGGGSSYGQSGYGRDAGQARRDWNSSDQYGRGPTQEERGWWDRATDEVSSWFGDDDAQRRRRIDAGHEGRGPKGYRRSDDRIREDVSDRLTDDPFVDASDIEIAVSGSEVTLTGTVDSRSARRRAEDLVERCSSVTHVQNNLRVASGAETTREERQGTTKGAFTKS